MTPILAARPPSRRRLHRLRTSQLPVVSLFAAVTAGVLVVLNTVVFNDPEFVDRITIRNDSGYDIQISVSDDSVDVMPVGVAIQHCATSFEKVIDQGATWHIRFRAQGRDGGEAIVGRTDLAGADWSYRIPDRVAEQLRSSGAPTPPQQACASAS